MRLLFRMSVNYNKLWKILIDKNLNRTEFKEKVGISFNVLARLGKNKPISLESLEKICVFLDCNIGEVMDFSSCVKLEEQSTSLCTKSSSKGKE